MTSWSHGKVHNWFLRWHRVHDNRNANLYCGDLVVSAEVSELIHAAESVLGYFVGEKYEQKIEAEGRPPIVPQKFRSIAAEQVMNRLNKALVACKAARERKFEVMEE
jgi:hypothetical protein